MCVCVCDRFCPVSARVLARREIKERRAGRNKTLYCARGGARYIATLLAPRGSIFMWVITAGVNEFRVIYIGVARARVLKGARGERSFSKL